MKKTLLQKYLDRTTFAERNANPLREGIVATLSDIVERENSFENMPQALDKIQEFHRLLIDRSKLEREEDLEQVATAMTLCLSMAIFEKSLSIDGKKVQ